MSRHDAVIVGAGPAGLAAAAMLRDAGLEAVVLERADRTAARWHTYYDRMELQSPRWMTSLPGHSFPRSAGRWPGRDAVIDYLEDYARHYEIDIRHGVEVERVERSGDGWTVNSPSGRFDAPYVVIATGYNNIPFVPDWPGRESFGGEFLHGSAFMNAEPFRGTDVLVVGAGNSGSEIAAALAEDDVARVRLSVRTPPHVAPRQGYGVPSVAAVVVVRRFPTKVVDAMFGVMMRLTVGNLSRYGLERPSRGVYSKYIADGVTPILDTGIVKLVKAGRIEVVSAVEGFAGDDVRLADGTAVSPDVVIAATGYRQGLEPMVGHLGVLQDDGRPEVIGPAGHPDAPGLHFLGYAHPLSGNIREMSIDARKIARAIRSERSGRRRGHLFRRRYDHRRRRPGIPEAHSSLLPPAAAGQPVPAASGLTLINATTPKEAR
jgi:putative flavoprotein involved in K+ transport